MWVTVKELLQRTVLCTIRVACIGLYILSSGDRDMLEVTVHASYTHTTLFHHKCSRKENIHNET